MRLLPTLPQNSRLPKEEKRWGRRESKQRSSTTLIFIFWPKQCICLLRWLRGHPAYVGPENLIRRLHANSNWNLVNRWHWRHAPSSTGKRPHHSYCPSGQPIIHQSHQRCPLRAWPSLLAILRRQDGLCVSFPDDGISHRSVLSPYAGHPNVAPKDVPPWTVNGRHHRT